MWRNFAKHFKIKAKAYTTFAQKNMFHNSYDDVLCKLAILMFVYNRIRSDIYKWE